MSKILRRCLSLVLVIMLLASLSISGTLSASADNKTGDGLAAYAMTAYNEGWKYVWGGASYGYVDCSGLIYSYVGGGARVTEDMLYSSPESGYVSDGVPDIPGIGLWQPGHVGVYVGGGMAVDARDEISNVCYSAVSSKSWVMWFKVAGVSYGGSDSNDNSSVANDNQSTENTSTSKDTDSQTVSQQDTALSRGSQGSDVNALQERLKALGYFTENTTNYFGSITESALMEFQSAAGLSATGVYDDETKNALLSESAPAKYVEPESDSDSESDSEEYFEEDTTEVDDNLTDVETDSPSLDTNNDEESYYEEVEIPEEFEDKFAQFGTYTDDLEAESSESDAVYSLNDENSEISDIQYMLVVLGYFDYDITGFYCENTAEAVAQYQLDCDMDATGEIDEDTLNSIYNAYYGNNDTDSVESEDEYVYTDEDALGIGMKGKKVEDLQRSLVVWGYLSYSEISEFGLFDEATENAVINAQQSLDLNADGIVTQEFVSALSAGNDSSSDTVSRTEAAISAQTSTDSESTDTSSVSSETQSTQSVQPAAVSSSGTESTAVSEAPAIDVPKTGVTDYFSKTLALVVIGISMLAVFFACTIHYWNTSMEKRRNRSRKATTVSVYRRGSM